MNIFDDMVQRVSILNSQLRLVDHDLGSEARRVLHNHLWRIVEELNDRLSLRLENCALDLHTKDDQLIIHYYSRSSGSMEQEVNIFIDRSFAVERHTKDLSTGNVETSGG